MSGSASLQTEQVGNAGPFYVYLLSLPDGTPCYVGKGKDNRIDEHERYRTHNARLRTIINDLKKTGQSLIKTKLHENLSEDTAYELESAAIFRIGRCQFNVGPLVNRTDGGDRGRNIIVSAETRKKQRLAKLGKTLSPEHRAKIGASSKGRRHSQETAQLLREKMLGRKKVWREGSYERWVVLQRLNNPGHTGHHHSESTKAQLRELALAQWARKRSVSNPEAKEISR